MNFILKDNSEGGTISFDSGQFYAGDGTTYTVAGNFGLPLGDDGFLSVSLEKAVGETTFEAAVLRLMVVF